MTDPLKAKGNDALRFPFAAAPASGTTVEVAPGVAWLRMPLPFALNHINLWVLDDGDGWTLVDTGINTPATQELWAQLIAGPLSSKPVKRLIVTHFHPDHIGLAGWLVEQHRIPMWITPGEMDAATFLHTTTDIAGPAASKVYERAGVAEAIPAAMKVHGGGYRERVYALPRDFIAIDPEQTIAAGGTTWHVVVGEGHSPQMAALYSPERKVLISGDQILPGITPNIGVRNSQPNGNPLERFISTLARFRALPDDTLVLPSHKLPFYGLHARVDQLIQHHRDRLAEALAACATGATAGDVLKVLFKRELDPYQFGFALGETVAHLNYLLADGSVTHTVRPDGVYIYKAA